VSHDVVEQGIEADQALRDWSFAAQRLLHPGAGPEGVRARLLLVALEAVSGLERDIPEIAVGTARR
jgi:hypothetical protein